MVEYFLFDTAGANNLNITLTTASGTQGTVFVIPTPGYYTVDYETSLVAPGGTIGLFTSSSSPYWFLNTNTSQPSGNNDIYAASTGFTIGPGTILNINTGTYIFLAIA